MCILLELPEKKPASLMSRADLKDHTDIYSRLLFPVSKSLKSWRGISYLWPRETDVRLGRTYCLPGRSPQTLNYMTPTN